MNVKLSATQVKALQIAARIEAGEVVEIEGVTYNFTFDGQIGAEIGRWYTAKNTVEPLQKKGLITVFGRIFRLTDQGRAALAEVATSAPLASRLGEIIGKPGEAVVLSDNLTATFKPGNGRPDSIVISANGEPAAKVYQKVTEVTVSVEEIRAISAGHARKIGQALSAAADLAEAWATPEPPAKPAEPEAQGGEE